ncbi:LysR substrate-binding domain-containing protein [Streptomyces lavendulocolor]|uniref:LysR substrate-binding domain-containing protein n=1 Tax=Streptomyces lavendulocolor TaxID=67316 RepID=UPI003C2BAA1C
MRVSPPSGCARIRADPCGPWVLPGAPHRPRVAPRTPVPALVGPASPGPAARARPPGPGGRARAGRRIIRIAEWTGKFGYVAAGLGVALVPSFATRTVPGQLVLRRLTDPALRRTVHVALPTAPLPAALVLRDLPHATAGRPDREDGRNPRP